MQKIETLLERDEKYRAIDKVREGCEWVVRGEGVATVKVDGSACAVVDGVLYRRHKHDAKKGDPPEGWIHWTLDTGQRSGHGWLRCVPGDPSCRYHWEAWENSCEGNPTVPDGLVTCEMVGPKSNGNPHRLDRHELWQHGEPIEDPPVLHEGAGNAGLLREWLEAHPVEGIVWHHHDGRMVKIKRRDFGIPWPEPR